MATLALAYLWQHVLYYASNSASVDAHLKLIGTWRLWDCFGRGQGCTRVCWNREADYARFLHVCLLSDLYSLAQWSGIQRGQSKHQCWDSQSAKQKRFASLILGDDARWACLLLSMLGCILRLSLHCKKSFVAHLKRYVASESAVQKCWRKKRKWLVPNCL